MKNQDNIKYIKAGVTALAVVALSMLLFFGLFRSNEIRRTVVDLVKKIMPFVYGAVIAYLLAPACNWFQQQLMRLAGNREAFRKYADVIAIVLSLLLAIAVVWALIMLVLPEVMSSAEMLVATLPGRINATVEWFHDLLENQPQLQGIWDTTSTELSNRFNNWMENDLIPSAQSILGSVSSGVINVFVVLKDLIIGLIVSVYFLAERKRFAAQARIALYGVFRKKWADLILDEVNYADMMFNGFIMGKMLDSAIIGLICFIGCSVMGFTATPLISVVIGVTNIIPFFGPFIGAVPCAFLLLLQNPLHCLYFVLFIIVLQQVDGNIIGPKILGNTTGLSSFWVLFAILLFGGLWGFVGMIVGVPLFAVIYDIARRILFIRLSRNGAGDMLTEYNHDFGAPPAGQEEQHKAPPPRSRFAKKAAKKQKRDSGRQQESQKK